MANGVDDFENTNIIPSSEEGLVLPPNTDGSNVANQIDAATIGNFNFPGQNVPSSDAQFIQQQLDPLGGAAAADPNATDALFRGGAPANAVQLGTTSGQLTGSSPIIVAGNQGIPFALAERRQAVQQAAARKRAEDIGKFQFPKAALSQDPRFNKNIARQTNDVITSFLGRAEKEFGSRQAAIAALTDPRLVQTTKLGREFSQTLAGLETVVKEGDQVVELMAGIESAVEKGDKFVSEDTQKIYNNFKNLAAEFEGGNINALAGFRDKLLQLQTSTTLDQFFKDNSTLSNISGDIFKSANVDRLDTGQFLKTEAYTKSFKAGARAQAKAIKNNVSFKSRDISEDEIFNRIMDLKGKFSQKSETVVGSRTPQPKGGFSEKPEDINRRKETITTLQNAFQNPDGTFGEEPTEEAKKLLGTLIGAEMPGQGSIVSAEFVKGKPAIPADEDGNGGSPATNDHIEIRAKPKSGARGGRGRKSMIDMSDPKAFIQINGILNESKSEAMKIKNESFDEKAGKGSTFNVSQEQVDEAAEKAGMTQEEYIEAVKKQGNNIQIR